MHSVDIDQIARKYRIESYMAQRFIRLWGIETTEQILKKSETAPPSCIRCNMNRTTPAELAHALADKGFELLPVKGCDHAFLVSQQPSALSHTTEYLSGLFFIQTQASLYAPLVLDPLPDSYVIDLAAAPGGKTTHLSELMTNKGVLVAVESNKARIPSLIYNIQRMGAQNAVILQLDARSLRASKWKFDRILLDAPCSGEGLLAVDTTRRTSRTLNDLRVCSLVQSQLLDAAVNLLAPGGILVYSTCSYAPEENEQQIDLLLRRYPHLDVSPINLPIGASGLSEAFGFSFDPRVTRARRLYPHLDGTIGFFIAKIISGAV